MTRNTIAMELPARSTAIEVSSSLIRASAPGTADENAAASRSAIRRLALLDCEIMSPQVRRARRLTQVSGADDFQRTPHRGECEFHFVHLNVEWRGQPHYPLG